MLTYEEISNYISDSGYDIEYVGDKRIFHHMDNVIYEFRKRGYKQKYYVVRDIINGYFIISLLRYSFETIEQLGDILKKLACERLLVLKAIELIKDDIDARIMAMKYIDIEHYDVGCRLPMELNIEKKNFGYDILVIYCLLYWVVRLYERGYITYRDGFLKMSLLYKQEHYNLACYLGDLDKKTLQKELNYIRGWLFYNVI